MKKETLRKRLNITQDEMAMLLLVSRPLLSLFELGLRSLPTAAMSRYAALQRCIDAPDETDKPGQMVADQANRKHLERLLVKNKRRQLAIAKKMAITTKKQEAQRGQLKLAAFLRSHETGKNPVAGLPDYFTNKAGKETGKSLAALLFEQQHSLELLELERSLIETKLKDYDARV